MDIEWKWIELKEEGKNDVYVVEISKGIRQQVLPNFISNLQERKKAQYANNGTDQLPPDHECYTFQF